MNTHTRYKEGKERKMHKSQRKDLHNFNKARIKRKTKQAPKKSDINTTNFDYVKSAWLAGAKLNVNIKQKRYKVHDNT